MLFFSFAIVPSEIWALPPGHLTISDCALPPSSSRALQEQIPYFHLICGRIIRDLGRPKRDVARERSLEAALDESSAHLDQWLAAEQSSPSDQAQRHELSIQLAAELEALPEAQREAVVLHYWQSWSLPRIAEHLGRSPAAVAGLVQRGLRTLRRQINPEE